MRDVTRQCSYTIDGQTLTSETVLTKGKHKIQATYTAYGNTYQLSEPFEIDVTDPTLTVEDSKEWYVSDVWDSSGVKATFTMDSDEDVTSSSSILLDGAEAAGDGLKEGTHSLTASYARNGVTFNAEAVEITPSVPTITLEETHEFTVGDAWTIEGVKVTFTRDSDTDVTSDSMVTVDGMEPPETLSAGTHKIGATYIRNGITFTADPVEITVEGGGELTIVAEKGLYESDLILEAIKVMSGNTDVTNESPITVNGAAPSTTEGVKQGSYTIKATYNGTEADPLTIEAEAAELTVEDSHNFTEGEKWTTDGLVISHNRDQAYDVTSECTYTVNDSDPATVSFASNSRFPLSATYVRNGITFTGVGFVGADVYDDMNASADGTSLESYNSYYTDDMVSNCKFQELGTPDVFYDSSETYTGELKFTVVTNNDPIAIWQVRTAGSYQEKDDSDIDVHNRNSWNISKMNRVILGVTFSKYTGSGTSRTVTKSYACNRYSVKATLNGHLYDEDYSDAVPDTSKLLFDFGVGGVEAIVTFPKCMTGDFWFSENSALHMNVSESPAVIVNEAIYNHETLDATSYFRFDSYYFATESEQTIFQGGWHDDFTTETGEYYACIHSYKTELDAKTKNVKIMTSEDEVKEWLKDLYDQMIKDGDIS